MTRLEKLHYAVKILENANEFARKHNVAGIYDDNDIRIDEDKLRLSIDGVVFEDELKKMDYLYLVPNNDYLIILQF